MSDGPLYKTHHEAWRIVSEERPPEYGVLVECGPREFPYWWVLCPAAATLHVNGCTDILGCSDPSCDWEDVHLDINRMWRILDALRPIPKPPA